MVQRLDLYVDGAEDRCTPGILGEEMKEAGIRACLLLPTAPAAKVRKTNRQFSQYIGPHNGVQVFTAGTLHPSFNGNKEELEYLFALGIQGIKLCSFSQGFSLEDRATLKMFDLIEERNDSLRDNTFFVILDTYYEASIYFGSDPQNITTPRQLANLVQQYRGINFIAAHMGGQCAPFDEICRELKPSLNLYLDTSNAAHTLTEAQFVHLLQTHGPEQVIFGTDWPWVSPKAEIQLIEERLTKAGFSKKEKKAVLGDNIAQLLGIYDECLF